MWDKTICGWDQKAQREMVEYNWNRTYHRVGLWWEPRIVRVLNDDVLHNCLFPKARKQSYRLSAYARDAYQKQYGQELKISEKSLACEIYWHYMIREYSVRIERRFGKKRLTQWLIYHMDVIDCGERSVDSNRFLWDLLSILF